MSKHTSEQPLYKVTSFITRGSASERQLLVFHHAGGFQVPAGTVETGESVPQAALREAKEESGLSALSLVTALGMQRDVLPPDEAYLVEDVLLQLSPDSSGTVVRGAILRRGLKVRVLEARDDYSRISHETGVERDGEYVVTARRSGWVQRTALAQHVERYFFHFDCLQETPNEWRVQGESDARWTCRWLPLTPDLRLLEPQQPWLDAYIKVLKA